MEPLGILILAPLGFMSLDSAVKRLEGFRSEIPLQALARGSKEFRCMSAGLVRALQHGGGEICLDLLERLAEQLDINSVLLPLNAKLHLSSL